MSPATLVLGLGNVLLRDEAVGVWVVEELRRRFEFPAAVTLLEGGTLGLDLLPRLEGVDRLLLIDVVRAGGAPGEVTRLEGGAVPAVLDHKVSPHQVGLKDLLATARLVGREPSKVVLWGVEPGVLEPGTGFSPPVAAALPRVTAAVLDELRGWGLAPRAAARREPPPRWWGPAEAAG